MPEDTPTPDELIWVKDAEKEYRRSRLWLDSMIGKGLTYYTIPGDKRYYLRRSDLDRLLSPRAVQRESGRESSAERDGGTQAS